MLIPNPWQRLQANASKVLAIGLLATMSIAIAWQSAELWRLVRSPANAPVEAAVISQAQTSPAPIAQLFGSPAHTDTTSLPATNLQLTLLGSFVNSDAQHSSAVLQRQGEPAQRYTVGSEVSPGVRLDAVHADHVELLRNGRRESLAFPRASNAQYSAYTPPAEPAENTLDQLDQLQQDNVEDLRQRMQALRAQMEASGEADTAPDQPQESE